RNGQRDCPRVHNGAIWISALGLTACAGVAGNYHKTESFFAIKEDPIHRSRNGGYCEDRGGHDRQYPKAWPRPPGRLVGKFAELLCRAAAAGDREREIAVQDVSLGSRHPSSSTI